MVILRSVFVSVPFDNFPWFYCCVSILKVRCKERLKNGKKKGVKTVRKIITVQRTFKKLCNNIKLQESKHECMVFSAEFAHFKGRTTLVIAQPAHN